MVVLVGPPGLGKAMSRGKSSLPEAEICWQIWAAAEGAGALTYAVRSSGGMGAPFLAPRSSPSIRCPGESLPSGSKASVKGLAFLSVMRALSKLRGDGSVKAALSRMNPEVADAFRYGSVVATGWYPVAWYLSMWRSIRESSGEGVAIARVLGREALRQDLTLVHKVALGLLSPKNVVSIGGRLSSQYYRPTQVTFETAPGMTRVRYSRCFGWDENMWAEIAVGIEVVLELAGAKHARIRMVAGGQSRDDYADFEVHRA